MPWEAPPQTYLSGNTAGTTHVFGPIVTLQGSNITLSGSGNKIVLIGPAGATQTIAGSAAISAGTQSVSTGTVKFADSNGITFGMSGSSQITATVKTDYLTAQSAFVFSNSNGISWGTNASTVTATVKTDYLTSQSNQALSGSNGSFAFQSATFGNLNGLSFYSSNGSMVGSYTVPNVPAQTVQPAVNAAGVSNTGNTLGNTGTSSGGTVVFAGSGGITASQSTAAGQSTIWLSVANPVAQTVQPGEGIGVSNTGNTAGNTGTASSGTFVFAASGGLTASQSTGAGISTLWYSVGPYITTARASTDAIGLNTAKTNVTWTVNSSGLSLDAGGYAGTISGATNCSVTVNTAGVSVNVPAETAGTKTLSCWEPYWLVSGTGYSSHAPASWEFIPWIQPTPVAISNLIVHVSMNASVPGATSAASTGTERFSYNYGATIFTRQNYGAQSTNLSAITTASFGLTAGLSYSSTSQSFVMSWVTNSTGGTTSFNTTRSDGNWSSYVTGPKFISIPLVTTLQEGEYWIAFQHSSTSGTTNSNVTLLSFSKLQQQWPVITVGSLGGSATLASSGPAGMGIGIASAVTTNNTMAGSVVSASTQPLIYFVMSNV